jgi:hypothetical protein
MSNIGSYSDRLPLHHRLEFRTIAWRVEVRPLTSGHLERARHSFIDWLDEAERMRLRMDRGHFFGAGFRLLKPAGNRAYQWRLPSIADEPRDAAQVRREHAPFPQESPVPR